MLGNVKVWKKLVLLCATFLAPIIFLAYLFIAQTEKDVTFAAKELDGNLYINGLRDELKATRRR